MSHSHARTAIRTIYFSIFGNVLLATAKWLAGYWGNSYALIADAIESSTDIVASILVLVGLRYITRPADADHPYGHGRAEPLITFVVVGFMMISATLIAFESIQNLQTPHEIPKPFTLWVLAVIILWKEISFQIVWRKSKQTNSSSLKADAWHHRSDAITSVAAFVGISVALWLGEGYEAADDWAALFAAGFIFYNSYGVFRPALGEIMDENLHEELIENVRKIAKTVEGVTNTEKCWVRKTGFQYFVDLHINVRATLSVYEGHRIAHAVKAKITQEIPEIANVLIHVEPDEN